MPQPIIRTVNGESRQWDGSQWVPMQASTPDQPSATSRFVSGAVRTSPFNPLNALSALLHPIDTVSHVVTDPIRGVGSAITHAKNAITNPGNEGMLGRLTEGMQAIEGLGSAVPFIGKAGTNAGEKIGNGDVAGGAGELTGLASSMLLPEAAERTPGAMQAAGGGLERAGSALADTKVGGYGIPSLGVADAILRGDPKGLAVAAAPYAMKYGGKGLKAAGSALEGIPGSLRALGEDTLTHDDLLANGEKRYVAGKAQQDAAQRGSGRTSVRDDVPYPDVRSADTPVPDDFLGSMGPDVEARPMPGTSNPEFQQVAPGGPRVGAKAPALNDVLGDVLDSLREPEAPGKLPDTPSVRSMDRGNLPGNDWYQNWVDQNSGPAKPFEMDGVRYEADASGSHKAVPPSLTPGEDLGISGSHDLRGGQALPGAMTPTELLQDNEDWYGKPADPTLGDWFDQGSTEMGTQAAPMKGEEGYAYDPSSPNLRDDPQTPIDDLLARREDAIKAGNLDEARSLSRSISQRNKIALDLNGFGRPFNKGISVLKVKTPPSLTALGE